MPLLLLNDSI